MFHEKLDDNIGDEISTTLAALNARPTWDGEKHRLFDSLVKLLKKNGYKSFSGKNRTYDLTRSGESCLYDVPTDQRGFLSAYRNKRVRLVCMGSRGGFGDRAYRVAEVPVIS